MNYTNITIYISLNIKNLYFLVEPKYREKCTASFYFSLTDHTHKELEVGQKDFHPGCARKFFGTKDVPLLEYKHEDLNQLAEQVIRVQTSLTGVQPKLSLNLNKHNGCNRLTIVGLWGDYIFKPQTERKRKSTGKLRKQPTRNTLKLTRTDGLCMTHQ